jgi:hypothetical protein
MGPPSDSLARRKVGFLLGLGIAFIPAIFAFFTLRKGHSTVSRAVAFSWLGFALLITLAHDDRSTATASLAAPIPATQPQETPPAREEEPSGPHFRSGTYLVGKEIQPGLYRAFLREGVMGMGYIERAKNLEMELDSIIANIVLTGDGYVEIKSTDKAVKLRGVELVPIDLKALQPNLRRELDGGIYLVGYDLAPGTYKAVVTDQHMNMGYVERARHVSMGMDDIIANEIIQGQGYVTVKKTDFAIRIQGAHLVKQD